MSIDFAVVKHSPLYRAWSLVLKMCPYESKVPTVGLHLTILSYVKTNRGSRMTGKSPQSPGVRYIHRTTATTATVLQPLYRSTCVSPHPELKTGGFCGSKVLLLLLLATSIFRLGRRCYSLLIDDVTSAIFIWWPFYLEEASTHKSAKTPAGTVFVFCDILTSK